MKKIFTTLIVFVFGFILMLSPNVFAVETIRPAVFDVEYSIPRAHGIEPVPLDQIITVKFSRNIKRGNGKITFFDWKQNAIPFTEKIDGDKLIITPVNDLNYNTNYYVEIFNDAIENAEDDSPNFFKGNQKYVINFSTQFLTEPELKKIVEQQIQSSTEVTASQVQQLETLQFSSESNFPPIQTYTLQKYASKIFQLNSNNASYKLWTSNPQVVNVTTHGDILIVTGLNTGTSQVAIRNLVDDTKVVFDVIVQ